MRLLRVRFTVQTLVVEWAMAATILGFLAVPGPEPAQPAKDVAMAATNLGFLAAPGPEPAQPAKDVAMAATILGFKDVAMAATILGFKDVAMAATILGFLAERRERFTRMWLEHAIEGDSVMDGLDMYLLITVRSHEPDETHLERVRAANPVVEFARYHWDMAEKYYRASGRPWLPVASDPTALRPSPRENT